MLKVNKNESTKHTKEPRKGRLSNYRPQRKSISMVNSKALEQKVFMAKASLLPICLCVTRSLDAANDHYSLVHLRFRNGDYFSPSLDQVQQVAWSWTKFSTC